MMIKCRDRERKTSTFFNFLLFSQCDHRELCVTVHDTYIKSVQGEVGESKKRKNVDKSLEINSNCVRQCRGLKINSLNSFSIIHIVCYGPL